MSLLIYIGVLIANPIKSLGQQDDKIYGIGVMFRLDTTYNLLPVISKVIENSTAKAVGLQEGWHILMVDGVNLRGKNQREVMNLIRGIDGTYVKLLIGKSKNPKDTEEYIVRRRQIPTK
jgi:C-terminal processing protease CtpA/Prc